MLYVLVAYLLSPITLIALLFRKKNVFKRILVIQTAKIGDLICSTPVFREIKRKYPDSYLTVIVHPVTTDLLENNPHIDEIITITEADVHGFAGKARFSGRIRKGHYDAAICLNPNVPYAVALFWGLVPVRLTVEPDYCGTTFKLASVFFTSLERHVRGQLTACTYIKLLKAIGVRSENISKEVYRAKDADIKVLEILGRVITPLIGIGVSSGNKMKEMGAEKITGLIDKLMAMTDCCVVLIGSGQDVSIADSILAAADKKERIINAAGKFNLAELPGLIERLSVFIGVDSGITYMADAMSVPLINIAGPADMQDQRPTGQHALIIQKQLDCVPCSHAFKSPYQCERNTRECITSVSIEEICSSATEIISGK